MPISFFENDDGKTIIRAGNHPNTRRKYLSDINLGKLNSIAETWQLSECQKLKLGLRLQRKKNIFRVFDATRSVVADSTVARWLRDIEQSIQRIATYEENHNERYQAVIDTMSAMASELAADEDEFVLAKMGFDIQHGEGFVDFGTYKFLRDWFRSAKIISLFVKKTEQRLKDLNRPKDRLTQEVGKEAWIYGVVLPLIYKDFTGKDFGISKSNNRPNRSGGVAFALDCAEAMGIPTVTPDTVASHWNRQKKEIKTTV
jgi:superfamily I DNA/RNA helicase